MNKKKLQSILNDTEFSLFGVEFSFFIQEKGDGFLIQTGAQLPCNDSGVVELMKGGKYYISSYSAQSEVVFKALQACLSFVEHEARECFTYKGTAIVYPHLRVDDLKKFVDETTFSCREAK